MENQLTTTNQIKKNYAKAWKIYMSLGIFHEKCYEGLRKEAEDSVNVLDEAFDLQITRGIPIEDVVGYFIVVENKTIEDVRDIHKKVKQIVKSSFVSKYSYGFKQERDGKISCRILIKGHKRCTRPKKFTDFVRENFHFEFLIEAQTEITLNEKLEIYKHLSSDKIIRQKYNLRTSYSTFD